MKKLAACLIALALLLAMPAALAEAAAGALEETRPTAILGSYEQDDDADNGPEPIEWIIVDQQDGMKLYVSRYGLDAMAFHSAQEDVTWADSDLRAWLNGEFLNTAFTDEERERIVEVTVSNPVNPDYSTGEDADTRDRVFLLSTAESAGYFPSAADRLVTPTPRAVANGAIELQGRCIWWLRTPGTHLQDAAIVQAGGSQAACGLNIHYSLACVRPAMWVKPEA